jgi:iron(III) transport system permease protein
MTALAPPRQPYGSSLGAHANGATSGARAPWPLVGAGLVVAGAAILPLVYLVIRAAGAEGDVLAFLTRPRTLGAVAGSLVLAASVGLGTIIIGVPVAWLTARTDLPGRRAWAVLTAIPLALPSYLVGFAFL